jgi:hypothetical protein
MKTLSLFISSRRVLIATLAWGLVLCVMPAAWAQRQTTRAGSSASQSYGPVLEGYLRYLHDEQEVVDDRVSRKEISAAYYRRNSQRIQALKEMAIRVCRESGVDFVPELEALAPDEFGTVFENPPRAASLKINQIVENKFRYLGMVRAGEAFYLFARLDPYEQQQLKKKSAELGQTSSPELQNRPVSAPSAGGEEKAARPRRATPPHP